MNSAIFVVLVLLWGAECRPAREDVLAGADFLAFFMRSHRPRSMQIKEFLRPVVSPSPTSTTPLPTTFLPSTLIPTTTTEPPLTTTTTEPEAAFTTVVTEPPSVVAVRVSSSVRKEAVQENIVPSSAQTSHFIVETSGYREKLEDSVAEASQDFHDREDIPKDVEKKLYDEALTFEESGLGYESRVSSETSKSRVYFSQPKPMTETVVVHTSQTTKIEPQVAHMREERKYVPQYQNHELDSRFVNLKERKEERPLDSEGSISYKREDRQYGPHNSQNRDIRQFSNRVYFSQANRERHYSPRPILLHRQGLEQHGAVTPNTAAQPNIQHVNNEQPYRSPPLFNHHSDQKYFGSVQQPYTQHPMATQNQEQQNHAGQLFHNQPQQQEVQAEPQPAAHPETGQPAVSSSQEQQANHQDRHLEPAEENYEVDEAISVMTNGRTHGVQTDHPPHGEGSDGNNKSGFVQEGRNYRKYRVEEKTPDGFIVGEYGVVNHDDGGVRGVRYTADGSINPRLIYEALVKFLSLKR